MPICIRYGSYISSMASSLAECGGQRANPTGPPCIFVQQGNHKIPIHFIKTVLIHAEHAQGFLCHFAGDAAGRRALRRNRGRGAATVGNAGVRGSGRQISWAPASSIWMLRIFAERRRMISRSSGS